MSGAITSGPYFVNIKNDKTASPPHCISLGHEALPAAALGIFDDGAEVSADVPFCAECAHTLIRAGEYRVTTVLDSIAFGSLPCPVCGGTGRLSRRSGKPTTPDSAEEVIREVSELVKALDDAPLAYLTPLFYEHGYSELRLAVVSLLKVLEEHRGSPSAKVPRRRGGGTESDRA